MTSFYLEKKSREWIILISKVTKNIEKKITNVNNRGLIFFTIPPLSMTTDVPYIEFYNPYKKLVFKAEIRGFLYGGLRKRNSKKRKSGEFIKFTVDKGLFNFIDKEKENTSSILNYEILSSSYFTYDDFMKLYEKVNYLCKENYLKRNGMLNKQRDKINLNF